MDFNTFNKSLLDACHSKSYLGMFALEYALKHCCTLENGWVGEFGVFSGRTLDMIRRCTPNTIPVFGFDTFTGLPETWRDGYEKGAFNRNGCIPAVMDNVTVVKGLFQETLPPLCGLLHARPLRLLHVDCDIYSGAKTVLDALEPCIIPGTVIVFDELINYPGYEAHEMKALFEFCQRTGKEFDVVGIEHADAQPVIIVIR